MLGVCAVFGDKFLQEIIECAKAMFKSRLVVNS